MRLQSHSEYVTTGFSIIVCGDHSYALLFDATMRWQGDNKQSHLMHLSSPSSPQNDATFPQKNSQILQKIETP